MSDVRSFEREQVEQMIKGMVNINERIVHVNEALSVTERSLENFVDTQNYLNVAMDPIRTAFETPFIKE